MSKKKIGQSFNVVHILVQTICRCELLQQFSLVPIVSVSNPLHVSQGLGGPRRQRLILHNPTKKFQTHANRHEIYRPRQNHSSHYHLLMCVFCVKIRTIHGEMHHPFPYTTWSEPPWRLNFVPGATDKALGGVSKMSSHRPLHVHVYPDFKGHLMSFNMTSNLKITTLGPWATLSPSKQSCDHPL